MGSDTEDRNSLERLLSLPRNLSHLYIFLTTPESYLLGAAILSGFPAVLFAGLNILALNCVMSQCPALEESSNSLASWIIFEGITLFFWLTSSLSFVAYFKIRRSQSSQR